MRISDWSSDVCSSDLEERVTRWAKGADGRWTCAPGALAEWDTHPADLYHAMMVGLRDYVERNRFPGVVLGLWGGSTEERRVGKEWVSTCRSRGSPSH